MCIKKIPDRERPIGELSFKSERHWINDDNDLVMEVVFTKLPFDPCEIDESSSPLITASDDLLVVSGDTASYAIEPETYTLQQAVELVRAHPDLVICKVGDFDPYTTISTEEAIKIIASMEDKGK